ncbi:unnamed protein product [Prunus armeniaca]
MTHMTFDSSQLSLATPFLGNDAITTSGGSGYVKITIEDLYVLPLVFGFKTRSREVFFSRDCVELACTLFLSSLLHPITIRHLLSTRIIFATLDITSTQVSDTND